MRMILLGAGGYLVISAVTGLAIARMTWGAICRRAAAKAAEEPYPMEADFERRVMFIALRLANEFPDWDGQTAWHVAERLVFAADQMAFQQDVERDLAALKVAG